MEEIWKDVYGFGNGYYIVSSKGVIKRSNRNTKQNRWKEDKPLHQQMINSGYYTVLLSVNNTQKRLLVHRLVWEAFNGPIPANMQVNHINEDRTDNQLENLNLMTCKENINWGNHIQRATKPNTNGKLSKPVIQYDLEGNIVKDDWPSIGEISRQCGYDSGTLSKCCNHKQSTYKGYRWEFKTA